MRTSSSGDAAYERDVVDQPWASAQNCCLSCLSSSPSVMTRYLMFRSVVVLSGGLLLESFVGNWQKGGRKSRPCAVICVLVEKSGRMRISTGSTFRYALGHSSLRQLGDRDASAIVSTADLDSISHAAPTAATAAARAAQPSGRRSAGPTSAIVDGKSGVMDECGYRAFFVGDSTGTAPYVVHFVTVGRGSGFGSLR
jgi:hypothetical protein